MINITTKQSTADIFSYSILSLDILALSYFLFMENLRKTTQFFVKITNVELEVNMAEFRNKVRPLS